MKKSVLALALAFGVTTAFAQDLTSKKGEPILPEAGDWALGIDATPFLQYAGNLFSGSTSVNGAPSWNSLTTPITITGKMMSDEKTAYRGSISLGFGSQKWTNLVDQDNFTGTGPTPKVEDSKKTSNSGVWLAGGLEMRRGKTRLQGYYGGEVGIGFSGTKDTYTYGNAFGSTNNTPESTNWTTMTSGPVSSRTLSNKAGSTISFGLRGFIGAEYFVLAKVSIGGEFGWGLGFNSTGEGETQSESWDFANNTVLSQTNKTGKSSSFSLGVDSKNSVFGPTGSLRMNLYF